MLPSNHVVTLLIGTLTEDPGSGIVRVNGITLDPLQSKSNYLSHLGILIWKASFWVTGVCPISWSINWPHNVKAKVTLFLFLLIGFRAAPILLLIYLGLGKLETGVDLPST